MQRDIDRISCPLVVAEVVESIVILVTFSKVLVAARYTSISTTLPSVINGQPLNENVQSVPSALNKGLSSAGVAI